MSSKKFQEPKEPEEPKEPKKWTYFGRLQGDGEYLENVNGYRPGLYHAVHIEDRLDSGRYRVLNKLGYGGSATVWLCQDTSYSIPTYVAVKILIAAQTEKKCGELRMHRHLRELGVDKQPGAHLLCFPLRDFRQTGPNGTHICIVYPVLGPELLLARQTFEDILNPDDCARTLRGLVQQVASGVALLHANGICHGDLRPQNVLLQLKSLDGLSTKQVTDIFGEPESLDVLVKDHSGQRISVPGIPQYLVYPVDLLDTDYLSGQICITDFGEAFSHLTEGERRTGIPRAYAAPELVFDKKGGRAADLWALACLASETRLGGKILEPCELLGPNDREYLLALIVILGKLPDKWWNTMKKRDSLIVRSDGGTHSRLELRMERWGNPKEDRSIDAKIRTIYRRHTSRRKEIQSSDISDAEVEVMSKFLEQLLQYEPEKRLAAQDAINHEWFRM